MAKSNAVLYTVTVYDVGITSIAGDIIEANDKVTIIRARKSGSSKYMLKTIPADAIVGVSGGVGKPSEILYNGRFVVRRMKNCVVEPSKNGMLVTQTDTNTSWTFNPVHIEAVAEKDVEAPKAALVYKKPKIAKSGRKKAENSGGEKKAAKDKKKKV